MRVDVQKFMRKYNVCIPRPLYDKMALCLSRFYEISDHDFAVVNDEYLSRKANERALASAVSLNNKGMAFEKAGKLSKAIECYEKNILEGSYLTMHPYDRLCVLYRKQKDYKNELRVLDILLYSRRYADECGSYRARREKVLTLLEKQK